MNNVYSVSCVHNLLPVSAVNNMFQIFEQRKRLKIKSIFVDLEIYRVVAGPVQQRLETTDPTQSWNLQVGSGVAGDQFTSSFVNFSVLADLVYNGNSFFIRKTGQIFFDSFFVNERLLLAFNGRNSDNINDLNYLYDIVIETEIL